MLRYLNFLANVGVQHGGERTVRRAVNANTPSGNAGILSTVVSGSCTLLNLKLGSQRRGDGSASQDGEREEGELHYVLRVGGSLND